MRKILKDKANNAYAEGVSEVMADATLKRQLRDDPERLARSLTAEQFTEDIVGHLVDHSDYDVRVELAKNPHTPLGVLKRLQHDRDSDVLNALAGRSGLPEDIMLTLSESSDYDVRRTIARSPSLPARLQERLAGQDTDTDVLTALSRNPSLTQKAMLTLSQREELYYGDTGRVLARRPDLPAAAVKLLGKHHDSQIRCAIANREDLHPNLLMALSRASEQIVSHAAKNNPSYEAVRKRAFRMRLLRIAIGLFLLSCLGVFTLIGLLVYAVVQAGGPEPFIEQILALF